MDGCSGVNVVVFSQADECELGLEAVDPVVECGDGDFGFVFAPYGSLGLL